MANLTREQKLEELKKFVKHYPDFPKKGIDFVDIFSLFKEPRLAEIMCSTFVETAKNLKPKPDYVVGLEARGFLLGPIVAMEMKIPFVPIRKKGKLPGKCARATYKLEYGEDTIEIQEDYIKKDSKVLIVDDLLATGGTAAAASGLIRTVGCTPSHLLVLFEVDGLNGRKSIPCDVKVECLILV